MLDKFTHVEIEFLIKVLTTTPFQGSIEQLEPVIALTHSIIKKLPHMEQELKDKENGREKEIHTEDAP